MLASTTQFTAMIEGTSHVVEYKVEIDLPGGVYPDATVAVESLTIEAGMTSDMPDGLRTAVGYPALACDLTLSGPLDASDSSKTPAWLFWPWQTDSPLYRQDPVGSAVRVSVGLYPEGSNGTAELLRKFTGTIDEVVSVNLADGTVHLSCVDNRSKLRSLPDQPATVLASPLGDNLTAESVLDQVVYRASAGTIGTRPATRSQCVLNVGLRTSLLPDVGSLPYGASTDAPTYATGVFGSGLSKNMTNNFGDAWACSDPLGSTFFVEYFTNVSAGSGLGSGATLLVGDAAGVNVVALQVDMNGFQFLPPGDSTIKTWSGKTVTAGTHYVALKWTQAPGSTAWSATLYLDNASTTMSGTSTTARGALWDALIIRNRSSSNTFEAVQVTNETSPTPNNTFAPTAVLDKSLNTLQVVPALSGDPWKILQAVADAEQGVAGFDESGVFRFYNRSRLKSSTSVRTLTTANAIKRLESTASRSEVVTRVKVTATPWEFTPNTLVWSASTVNKVPPGRSTLVAKLDGDTLAGQINGGQAIVLADSHATDDGGFYYRASVDKSGVTDAGAVLTITATQRSSVEVEFEIVNSLASSVYLVSPFSYTDLPAGSPALWLGGTLAKQGDGQVVDVQWPPASDGGAAASRYGEIAYTVDDNPLVQTVAVGRSLATDLLADLYMPRPSLTELPILPDPRLQLADRVRLQDSTGTLDDYAILFRWRLNIARATWDMDIDARTIAPPGAWIGELAGRSEGDVTTYGY